MIRALYRVIICFIIPFVLFFVIKIVFSYPREKKWYQVLHFPAVLLTVISLTAGFFKLMRLISYILTSEFFRRYLSFLLPENNSSIAMGVFYLTMATIIVAVVEFAFLSLTYSLVVVIKLIRKLILKIKKEFDSDTQHLTNKLLGTASLQESVLTGWFVRRFYDFDSDPVYIRKSTVILRQWITVMKYCLIGFYALLLFIVHLAMYGFFPQKVFEVLSSSSGFTFFLPALLYVILSQAQFFMLGQENVSDWSDGENESKNKKKGSADYKSLVFKLAQDYGASLITAATLSSKSKENGRFEITNEQLNRCPSSERRAFLSLCRSLGIQGIEQNEQRTSAIVSLLQKKSLVVNDCFSGTFLPYIAAYLNYSLSLGNKVLVICPDEASVRDSEKVLRARFLCANDLDPIWQISDIGSIRSDHPTDVLVCTETNLLNENIYRENVAFFEKVVICVVTDAYRLYSRNHLARKLILSRLGRSDTDLRFICFTNEGSASFRDQLIADFNQDIDYYEDVNASGDSSVMIWKAESVLKPQSVMGLGNEPYFDLALCLTSTAIAQKIAPVSVVPDRLYPYSTDMDILSYCANENARREIRNVVENIRLDSSAVFEQDDCAVVAIHDSSCNLANLFELWSKYGGKDYTILNFISPDYMLRDYFSSNLLYFYSTPSAIEIFIPYENGLRRSELTALLVRMASEPVSERELLRISREMGYASDCAESFLFLMMNEVLHADFHGSIYQFFSFTQSTDFDYSNQTSEYIKDYKIRFSGADTLNEHLLTCSAPFVEFSNGHKEPLPIEKGDVLNYYLVGQYHTFSSCPESSDDHRVEICRVTGISNDCVSVVPDTRQQYRPQYAQVSELSLCNIVEASKKDIISNSYFRLERFTADAERHISGYYDLLNGSDLVDRSCWLYTHADYLIKRDRISVLHVCMDGEFGDDSRGVTDLLCRMLNELFVSLFPYTYQNIYVCCIRPKDYDDITYAEKRILSLDAALSGEGLACSDENAVHLYIAEFAKVEYGMINTIQNDFARLLRIILSYLNWAIDFTKSGSVCHLFYGMDEWPSIFRPEKLAAHITEMGIKPIETGSVSLNGDSATQYFNNDTTCDFCGCDIYIASKTLPGGRNMCDSCEKTAVVSWGKLFSLYRETKKELEQEFGITFPHLLIPMFRSAASIRKMLNNKPHGRVLSAYDPRMRAICVERGMPRNATQGAIVHALVRCWLYVNGNHRDNIPLSDGLCAFAEVKIIEKMDKHYADRLKNEYVSHEEPIGCELNQLMTSVGITDVFDIVLTKASD